MQRYGSGHTFFRRVQACEAPGYPRFKGRDHYASLTYPQYGNGATLEYSGGRWGTLTLSKLGVFKMRMHRPIVGRIKTVTLRRDGDQWYVCFSCEVAPTALPQSDSVTGIDLGLLHFATLSDGSTIENPRHLRRSEGKLKRAQRGLSRCKRKSHRRARAKAIVVRLHRKIRAQRSDFGHKQSRMLVNQYGTLVFEELAVKHLAKRPKPKLDAGASEPAGPPVYLPNGAASKAGLNKSILDAGWRSFQEMCVVKAESAGRQVLFVKAAYTSCDCSGCGHRQKMPLSVRVYSCPVCGLVIDRDHNAAINICRAGCAQRAPGHVEAAGLLGPAVHHLLTGRPPGSDPERSKTCDQQPTYAAI